MSFPKTILVKEEVDGDTKYLVAGTAENLSVEGETVVVARYALVGEGVVHSYVDYVEKK